MAAFPHLDKEKLDALLEIIERNRWDRLRNLQAGKEEDDEEAVNIGDEDVSAESVRIVLFGAESAFTRSLIEMYRVMTVIAYFDNPDQMITFCMDHHVPYIMLDIDPPTDAHVVMDVFASIRMLLAGSKIFVCSGRKMSLEVDHFKMYGATIMEKPILRKQVQTFYDQYLKNLL